MNWRILLLFFVLLIQPFSAWAQGTLAWSYDNTDYLVHPSDQIVVTATVTNSSLDPYTISGYSANFSGDLQKLYDFTFLLNLTGRTVPGQGVLHFDFGMLTPIGGYVAPGVYDADPAWIGFGVGPSPLSPDNNFRITVEVPEPSVWNVGGVGLLLFGALQLWRHSCQQQPAMSIPPLARAG
jgi:hypothetical protein